MFNFEQTGLSRNLSIQPRAKAGREPAMPLVGVPLTSVIVGICFTWARSAAETLSQCARKRLSESLVSAESRNLRGERMPSFSVPQGRRSKRVMSKRRASLVVNLKGKQKRLPCLVLDYSKEGFRLRGGLDLRRGQVVELILDEDPPIPERCTVVWVGKAGSKQEGEAGLETR
jgi:PilZ domain